MHVTADVISLNAAAHIVQLALTPIFLLTGIASTGHILFTFFGVALICAG